MTRANPDAIRRFLGSFSIAGPWVLARRGAWEGRSFTDLEEAVEMAARRNDEGYCIYYLGNERRPGATRRREVDMTRARGVWIDVDRPDDEVRRALLEYQPTFTVFTGGGWQSCWLFNEPTTDLADAKAIGYAMKSRLAHLQPDSTFSVDHIFRLPGTVNRKPKYDPLPLAELVQADWRQRLRLDKAPREVPPEAALMELGEIDVSDLQFTRGQLREMLPPWAHTMLTERPEGCPSRNEHQWAFIGAVLRELGDSPHARALVVWCLTRPATRETDLSHRSHWARQAGRLVPRRDPLRYAMGQLQSFLSKEGE